MKAYPEQPSGSVILLLATKKFSTPQCRNSESFFKRKVKKLHKSRKITFPALHLT